MIEVEKPQTQVLNIDEVAVLAQRVFGDLEESFWTLTCVGRVLSCPGIDCPFPYSTSVVGRLQTYSVLIITNDKLQKAIPTCTANKTLGITNRTSTTRWNVIFSYDAAYVPQRVLPEEANVSIKPGQNATLYCLSNSITTLYMWAKDGLPLNIPTTDGRLSYGTNRTGFLRIQNVSSEDSGHYKCSYTTTYPQSRTIDRSSSVNVVMYSELYFGVIL